MRRKYSVLFFIITVFIVFIYLLLNGSDDPATSGNSVTPVPDSVLFRESPVLSPQQALHTFQLEDGFEIELVASEPLIHDPIAMDFDEKGRIWVVEMRGFMSGANDEGDDDPTGRIVILEDKDDDGQMDQSKVFIDGLVLPRAVAVVNGGILFAEPPNLWFVENINDKPGKKVLVDSAYATSGNVEHLPNGLMRGIDNWYYNAKSSDRYRYVDDKWIKEKTEFRGQWGITKDNYGRLIYNTNSSQLRGDLFPPNVLIRNPNISSREGINIDLVNDQRVYPIRPTPGVNRGYQDHVLDEGYKLVNFTAACGPVIYRGDQFPQEYVGNAFVCEPAGNLVKRNILTIQGVHVNAEQAYKGKEFLASKDERFRPVSTYNAPDGTLYIIDMYRGIIQDRYYITDYLWEQAKSRELVRPIGLGRIYRVVKENGNVFQDLIGAFKGDNKPSLDKASAEELVAYLSHPNGWWRDTAQRLLVDNKQREIIPKLRELLNDDNALASVHALWVLEGLGAYDIGIIEPAFYAEDPEVVATAIRVSERNSDTGPDTEQFKATLRLYDEIIDNKAPLVQLQLALSLGEFISKGSKKAMEMLREIAISKGNDPVMREAIASSIYNKEREFLSLIAKAGSRQELLIDYLKEVAGNSAELNKSLNLSREEVGQFVSGRILYEKLCAGCHGKDGEGLVPIAPPLNHSEWVMGPTERLIGIILHGLEGPVTVTGKVYKEPEVQPVMPGLKDNHNVSDEEIAAILTYIRNAWKNGARAVNSSEVKEVREKTRSRDKPYTEKELLKILPSGF